MVGIKSTIYLQKMDSNSSSAKSVDVRTPVESEEIANATIINKNKIAQRSTGCIFTNADGITMRTSETPSMSTN